MFKTLKQQKGIVLAAVVTLAVLVAVGYITAAIRSEPKYRTKVDEIMFEEGNKSPKYVITLPEHQTKKIAVEETKEVASTAPAEPQKEDDGLTPQQRILANVPLMTKLKPIEGLTPLTKIDIDSTLVETVGKYTLPKQDGLRKPWIEYGNKVKVQPNFFRIAVIFKNFGIDKIASDALMKGMPETVSFAFSPYAVDAEQQIKAARTAGHETYMDLLLPSQNYLDADTGPLALDITVSPNELIRRIQKTLSVNAPISGMVVTRGHAGVDSMERLEKVLTEVNNRGLLLLDASAEDTIGLIKINGLARNKANIIIDSDFRPEDIRNKLKTAEILARNKGQVIIVAEPKPVVALEVRKWLDSFSPQMTYDELKEKNITTIERPFALIPLSNAVIE